MAKDLGTGVSRTLDAANRQFQGVVFQKGKPPLDAEVNLQDDLHAQNLRQAMQGMMPSGFFLDPTRPYHDFQFDESWSNYFALGNPKTATGVHEGTRAAPVVWANVNGWVFPVCGTDVEAEGDLRNLVKLYPPPESDARIDLVFLEAWLCNVAPNPSTVNKPAVDKLWKYGNTQYGGTNLTDDLEDPTIGFETTERLQLQYRIRVFGSGGGLGSSVSLDIYPDGLGDPNVLGQGTYTAPIGGFTFSNMSKELGDPSLWRAGDGDPNNNLGTYDGYTYAVPICAVFRRNSNVYVAVTSSGNPNQNGAFDRSPGTKYLPDPLAGCRTLLTATLTSDLNDTDGVSAEADIDVTNLNGSGWEDAKHVLSSCFMVIDDEIVGISAVDLVNNTVTVPLGGRGRYASSVVGHAAGTAIRFYQPRPDGFFADQITETDVLDLRRGVNANDWDFQRLLSHNVAALCRGDLRTAWKRSGEGDTQGPMVHEVDYLWADGSTAVPNHCEALDGPDGIRQVWSDAAVIQTDLTLLLDNDAPQDQNTVGFTNNTFDATCQWDVGPDFYPSGFMNVAGLPQSDAWTNGTSIFLYSGGADGTGGARGTFRDGSTRAVRFLTPYEYWKSSSPTLVAGNGDQNPWSLRFVDDGAQAPSTMRAFEPAPPGLSTTVVAPATTSEAARHVGPMYPWRHLWFEYPYIVLGGLVRDGLQLSVTAADLTDLSGLVEVDVGINFDAAGVYYSKDTAGNFQDDPDSLSAPLLRGSRTLFGMLTNGGLDRTGGSSEVYVVIYGDTSDRNNNGAFKVVGAGTEGYTVYTATNATSLVLLPLSADFSAVDPATGEALTVEIRSQEHNADTVSSHTAGASDLCIVMTDLAGQLDAVGGLSPIPPDHPWKAEHLGEGEAYDLSMPLSSGVPYIRNKMLLTMSLLYHPGRGGTARVADDFTRFGMRGGSTTQTVNGYLRQNRAALDTTFSAYSGIPADETFWDAVHVQTWNRLPADGWHAPNASDMGGGLASFTETTREHELFIDKGSKTVVFRPFRDMEMTLYTLSFDDVLSASECLLGGYTYPAPGLVPKDGLQIFTGSDSAGKQMGFVVPREFMPRFGRQDIPYWQRLGTSDPFLPGINHLFIDSGTLTRGVFNIIGGKSNLGSGPEVNPLFFTTNDPTGYGESSTVVGTVNNKPQYKARKTTDIDPNIALAPTVIADLAAVSSSDLGNGLKGIQLPPYLGIARLYGVYDLRDWDTKGGRTWKANRYEVEDDPAPNLLREDATQQTLFILQDGAQDLTQETGDHTYIVPSNVIDITRALQYADGDEFEDYEYVVEATIFGFAQGFIDENNYVLARHYNGNGDALTDGSNLEIEGVHMVLPTAAGYNHQCYAAYDRTVYQGDPFMTRSGDAKTNSDYEHRYGQLAMSHQWAMETVIQQFDSDGDFVPETPNARAFEVLATMDFFTTMGTGKVGGLMHPGTMLDVGFTERSSENGSPEYRAPDATDSPAWRILPRTYTEGQVLNDNRATLSLEGMRTGWNPSASQYLVVRINKLDGTSLDLWASTSANEATLLATPYSVPAEDIFRVEDEGELTVYKQTATLNMTLEPGEVVATNGGLTFEQAEVGDIVILNPRITTPDNLYFVGRVVTDGVNINVVNKWGCAFEQADAIYDSVYDVTADLDTVFPVDIPEGTSVEGTYTIAGIGVLSNVSLVVADPQTGTLTDGLVFTASVTNPGTDEVTLVVHNVTGAVVASGRPSQTFHICILKESERLQRQQVLTDYALDVTVIRRTESVAKTMENLWITALNHSKLYDTVTAEYVGDKEITLTAIPTGERGNGISVDVRFDGGPNGSFAAECLRLSSAQSNRLPYSQWSTFGHLRGGEDRPVNAGDGTSQLSLTGMTEKLPLGALLQDSDFLCENPLGTSATAMISSPSGPRPVQTQIPLTTGGEEFTRAMGEPGELIATADGSVSVTSFAAWTEATPTGSRRFRIYRGGGSAFVLSGENPGGPIDWVADTFPAASLPVLKGGVLACRAMLVRNFYEEATPAGGPYKVSDGDEVQMVVLTYGILGGPDDQEDGLLLRGLIGPAGYGEGYAAADRYRIDGRPMFRGFTQEVPNPANVVLAPHPDDRTPERIR